jgi:hypothetical protein
MIRFPKFCHTAKGERDRPEQGMPKSLGRRDAACGVGMSRAALVALAAVSSALVGCVAIQSELYDEGVVYHLPRTVLTITVTQYNDRAAGRTWYQIGKYKAGASGAQPTLVDEIGSAPVPDPGHRYVAKYRPDAMSDDRLCISRSQTGLLRDLVFASDDRTPEVVFNIARFIAGSLGEEKRTGLTSFEDASQKPIIRTYTGKLDPLIPADVRIFNRAMQNVFGEPVEIDVKRLLQIFREHTAPLPEGCAFGDHCRPEVWTGRCSSDRICYRTYLEVPIDLKRNGVRVDVNYAKVINPWDIGAISITRAFLVHKISKFRFDNGVLIGAVIRKPSEIEELSLLPLHVVYAALATPSAAVATAFGGDQANKVAVAQQLGTLTTQVQASEDKIRQLQQSLSGDLTASQDKDIYELQCKAPSGPSGTLVNIVTGN